MFVSRVMKRAAAAALLACLAVAPLRASNLPLPAPEVMAGVTRRDLKKHLSFLASDELGGRYTFSPSLRIAARYLASELESYGFRGAARGGSFMQRVPLAYRKVDGSASGLSLESGGGRQEFAYGRDFASENPVNADLSGELIFVGYGISSPGKNHDDYAGLDVKGKVVVMVPAGVPDTLRGVAITEDERGAAAARAHGAAAAISIIPGQFQLAWNQIQDFLSREMLGLASDEGGEFAAVGAGPGLTRAIAALLGMQANELSVPAGKPLKPAPLGARAALRVKVAQRDAPPTYNVTAILDGADPRLKDEYVVISAHYDHLETGPGGEVYNGADDDGSGTAAVLEIAQAFATGERPRRSVLVVFHTGEELGLYGSAYNADVDPVVPMAKLVADLNIDMIGRSRAPGDTDPLDRELTDKNSLYIIGSDRLSTELHHLSEQTNADTVRMRFDYTYNAENHPQQFYYRSDHYNYAKHGVPVIFYFTGVHRDYHKPTDDIDKIDFEKMERITRLIFATGWRIANRDRRLALDK